MSEAIEKCPTHIGVAFVERGSMDACPGCCTEVWQTFSKYVSTPVEQDADRVDALALLRTLEWSGHEDAYAGPWQESCPCCHKWKSEATHERNCELARLIGAVTA